SAVGPRPDPGEALRHYVHDVARRWVGHRWELLALGEANIGVSEAREKVGGATFRYAGLAVDDKILLQSPLVDVVRLDRNAHPRITPQVLELLMISEVSHDDLVAFRPEPDARDLGTAIAVERDQMG